jgi:hypothetical protein
MTSFFKKFSKNKSARKMTSTSTPEIEVYPSKNDGECIFLYKPPTYRMPSFPIFMFDFSYSMRPCYEMLMDFMKRQIQNFAVGQAFIFIAYGTDAQVVAKTASLTMGEKELFMAQIDKLRNGLGGTNAYAAIELAEKECKYIKEVAEVPDVQTIFMTDGNANEGSIQDARGLILKMTKSKLGVLHIVMMTEESDVKFGLEAQEANAGNSNSFANDSDTLQQVFANIVDGLSSYTELKVKTFDGDKTTTQRTIKATEVMSTSSFIVPVSPFDQFTVQICHKEELIWNFEVNKSTIKNESPEYLNVLYNLSVALTTSTETTAKVMDNAKQLLEDYEIVYDKETIQALQHADSVASQMAGLNVDDVPQTFRSLSSEIKLHTQHHLGHIASFEAQKQMATNGSIDVSDDDDSKAVYRSLNSLNSSGPPPCLHRLISAPRH